MARKKTIIIAFVEESNGQLAFGDDFYNGIYDNSNNKDYKDRQLNTMLMEKYHYGTPMEKEMAKETLLQNHEAFIKKLLMNYKPFFTQDNYEDFLQSARLGLVKSLETYNPQMSLTTYCPFFIKHEIQALIRDITNVTPHFSQILRKIKLAENELIKRGVTDYTNKDLADTIGITEKQVIRAKQIREASLLLYVEQDDCGYESLNIFTESPENDYMKRETERAFLEAIKKLEDVERDCLLYKYGAFGYEQLPLKDIGIRLGISVPEVRQALARGQERLKNNRTFADANEDKIRMAKRLLNKTETPILKNDAIESLSVEIDDYISNNDGLHEIL